ncbi:MAG: TonB-dependent receptor, partial [Alteromonadales bacterium]|nr:TonB-dependent receptor [Alteromonadales bacterium]
DELYEATSPGEKYSGDIYYRFRTAHENNNNTIDGVVLPEGTEVVRVRESFTQTATFAVENTAWYIEDSWQVADEWMIYGGLRGETFTNKDGNGEVFLESDNLVSPRVGFVWDIDGDSSKKLSASLGRYYVPVAANTNIRSTREESFYEHHYKVSGEWDAQGAPVGGLGEEFGSPVIDEQVPNPAVIADHNLEPMHQDELIVAYQQAVTDDWTLGAKILLREIQDGMDDFCGNDGFTRWAADNGYDNFDPHSMAGCVIINPGKDITLSMDLENDGNLSTVTTPAEYHGLPQYERSYKGLELTAEKAMSDNWMVNFSYVLSNTSGNAEGYVNSSLAQEDAGATQDFDHANFMHGSNGDLPTDRTHQFKAYGLYQFSDELGLSFNFSAVSGTPLSCQGYVSTDGMLEGDGSTAYDKGNFERYGASSFYCVGENGEAELSNRGDYGRSNWLFNTDLGLNYTPDWADGLLIQMSIYNVFDSQEPNEIDQQKDFERGNTKVSPNFLQTTRYQPARYVRFGVRYSF